MAFIHSPVPGLPEINKYRDEIAELRHLLAQFSRDELHKARVSARLNPRRQQAQ